MLNILIVEDDSQLAVTLKYLVEDNPRYRVIAIADDADSGITAAEMHQPDLVLLDLRGIQPRLQPELRARIDIGGVVGAKGDHPAPLEALRLQPTGNLLTISLIGR